MIDDLVGKRVLITGSTAGIGLAAAKAFGKAGAKIAINGSKELSQDILDDFAKLDIRPKFIKADLTKSAQCQYLVEEFVKEFGGIDVLVNNAGGLGGRSGLEAIDDQFYDRVMDLNARSALMVTRFAMPFLKESAKQGNCTASVISTGSIAGREGGGLGSSIYAASKAWLHNVQRNWVKEFSQFGIRFNIVSPGSIDTAFHADKSDELKEKITNTIAMGRFGSPEEVAPSFLFLASHAASGYITGQILDVNGGQMAP